MINVVKLQWKIEKNKVIFKMIVFIIGCGRSGTTILGKCISRFNEVLYLNEPRGIWHRYYKNLNIWKSKGQLIAKQEDHSFIKTFFLKIHFCTLMFLKRKKVLVEKLPVNAFRLDFLIKIFPKAKFIFIRRNALEVANSIDVFNKKQRWFGYKDQKWNELKKILQSKKIHIPSNLTPKQKGLFEWRLANEFMDEFLKKHNINEKKIIEINYSSFVDNPMNQLNRISTFLEIKKLKKLDIKIKRKSNKIDEDKITPLEHKIGGNNINKY